MSKLITLTENYSCVCDPIVLRRTSGKYPHTSPDNLVKLSLSESQTEDRKLESYSGIEQT